MDLIKRTLGQISWPELTRTSIGLGGMAAVVIGVWGAAGWPAALIVAGLPVGGLYYALEISALFKGDD